MIERHMFLKSLISLNDIKTKSSEEIVEIIATNLYSNDNLNIRDPDTFYNLPVIIRDIILLIDFDTEVTMQGILGFLENSTGLYFKDTIKTFEKIQAIEDYKILDKIESVLKKYYISTSDLRKNVNNQGLYNINSFSKLHGPDYENMAEEISSLADNLYISHEERNVFDLLTEYVSREKKFLILELEL
ncbi:MULTISPECIES: DMP19 family protein [Bacillaceae]|uniref:DMP19 family protein n=1 Tax=Bacillaceae TaxID=186817 RepID=UPI002964CA31|nr:DUF4375 domain-containing protein [Bacillus infantis]MDW2878257.1 DUF4375 domain-containing protein [Bacillus infantis]